MRSLLVFVLAALAPSLAMALVRASEPGNAYCFGVGCPCGNDDPTAGCINSTGVGGLLTVDGSTSVAADDMVFTGMQLPPTSVCLLVMGTQAVQIPFHNGLRCIGGDIQRLQQHQNSNQVGTVAFEDVVARYLLQGVVIQPGDHRYFQIWHRDTPAGATPCGAASNLTNGYELTFTL
jgi:hypothetical protein